MSPLPDTDRMNEYAAKAGHMALRQLSFAPEQVRGRQLARQAARRPPPKAGAKRVTILTPRDWASHVVWEAMIAQALRVRGADVRFVTCGGGLEICDRVNTYEGPPLPCASCSRYVHGSVAAHGFDWLDLREGWQHQDLGGWPELDELDLDQLLRVEDDGLPLGELISIPLRWFLMRSVLDDDPLAPLTARRFLRSARRIARGIDRALEEQRPEVVLVLNGLFLFESIASALCRRRNIDVVTYERGFLPDTLLFHRSQPENLYDVGPYWESARSIPLTADEDAELDAYLSDRRVGRRTGDRYWVRARFETPAKLQTGRRAVLFTNLTWDSAVLGQEGGFSSIHEWLVTAIDAFADRPNDELIVRIHPAEVKLAGKQTREPIGDFVHARYPTVPSNVRLVEASDPTSSYPLMEASDVGLVLTSTTGLELGLLGTPVIVAGNTHYRDKGFSIDVSSPAELVAALAKALDDPASVAPDVALARRYAHLFFFKAPVNAPGVAEHIPGLARITMSDLTELEPGANPSVDRICDGILEGRDFGPRLRGEAR
jgi:hypothetical protein